MPVTRQEFEKLRNSGFSTEKIAAFSKRRDEKDGITQAEAPQQVIDSVSQPSIIPTTPQPTGGLLTPLQQTEGKTTQRPDLLSLGIEGLKTDLGERLEETRKPILEQARDISRGVVEDISKARVPLLPRKEAGNLLSIQGGIQQRIEAMQANPILTLMKPEELQTIAQDLSQGKTTFQALVPKAKLIIEEARKGATGEKLGERGDIFRGLGVPETLSAILGFVTDPLLVASFFMDSKVGVANKITQQMDDVIDEGMSKAIRPKSQKTLTQFTRAKGQQREAVKTIVKNKDKLRLADDTGEIISKLPESLGDTAEAIRQTQKTIWDEAIQPALDKAGKSGVTISGDDLATKLIAKGNSKRASIVNPGLADEYFELAKRVKNRKLTPQQVNDTLQEFNQELANFYSKPFAIDPTIASKTAAQADAVKIFRSSLDDVMNKLGIEFKVLKNKYGALKSIEDSTMKAFQRNLTKATRGGSDLLSDFLSIPQLIQGVRTGNAGQVLSSVGIKAANTYFKVVRDPNRAIRNMFKTVEKLSQKSAVQSSRLGLKTGTGVGIGLGTRRILQDQN